MKFNNILSLIKKPPIYEKGNAVMWTDPYISKQLLDIHLHPDTDLASRKRESIDQTLNWILKDTGNRPLKILDLGCGPGLYTERLAEKGHWVTGVDFSENSIRYAGNQANLKNLKINYIHEDYLRLRPKKERYDLVTMIYTDFGVLLPEERNQLLAYIFNILVEGGIFLFDVMNDEDLENKLTHKTWDACSAGFWKKQPYLVLSESFLYEKQKVILYQHLVTDESGHTDVYRFWTHFFSETDISNLLEKNQFMVKTMCKNILPGKDVWNKDVVFCKAVKKNS